MVLIFYIICFLSEDQTVQEINGGATMQMMLSLGTGVMGFFALLFLFYTNSFLMKRRKKNLGCITFSVWERKTWRQCLYGKVFWSA